MRCLDNELEKNMDKLSIGAKSLTDMEIVKYVPETIEMFDISKNLLCKAKFEKSVKISN